MSLDIGRVLSALADPTRRELVDLLASAEPRTASELSEHFEITRQGVMKHLRVLSDAGVLAAQRSGREVRYRVDEATVRESARWFAERADIWDRQLAGLKRAVEG